MLYTITPEGRTPPTAVDAGELIVEGRARLEIAPDGRIARCLSQVERVIREVAGVRRPPGICIVHPAGQLAFEAVRGGDPRAVEISTLVYLREGAQR